MDGIGTENRIASRRGTHPNSLANLRPPWKPGDVPNPKGRPTAGAVVKEHWNALAGLSQVEIEQIAADPHQSIARRAAANRWLAALDKAPDLEQIIGHTDGKAKQSVDLSVRSEEAAEVHEGMDRLAADPEAAEQMQALAERLYGGGPFGN